MATFNNLVIDATGSYTLTASDGTLTGATSSGFTVGLTAAKLAITTQPSNALAGVAIAPAVTVAVENPGGFTVTSDNSNVTLTLNGGTQSWTVAAINGVATFSNLVIDTAGGHTLAASDTDNGTTLTNATSGSFTITPLAAAKLAFPQQPTNALAGVPLNPAVTVAVEDSYGNTVTTDSSTVTLTLSSGVFASGSRTVTVTAVNGVATFSNLVIDTTGTFTLAARDGRLTRTSSASFTVIPATATQLVFEQQPTDTQAGVEIGPAVTVAVEDSFGNIATTNTSNVTVTLSGGTLSWTVATVGGIAVFPNLIISNLGIYTLAANDGALNGSTSSSFAVNPLPPQVQSINWQNPSGSTAETTSVTYAVTFSEPVTGVTASDFQLALAGGTTASSSLVVSPTSGYNSVYTVTVSGISGHGGTLGLNLVDNGSIVDQYGNQLANTSCTFAAQQTYATDPAGTHSPTASP